MLYYDRIDISEGIDIAKRNYCMECMIYHYWFFNHGFNFQGFICNGYHDLKMSSVIISNITIITVKNVDYRCIFISLANLLDLLEIFEDHGYLQKIIALISFFLLFLINIYKMGGNICMYKS